MFGPALDHSLSAITLWVAWRALSHRDLFASVILFVVFGLLMSLVWIRLGAEDIALAEATIGAGLTGALLLDAIWNLPLPDREGGEMGRDPLVSPRRLEPRWVVAVSALLTLALGAFLALVMINLDGLPGGLSAQVTEHLARSGVAQPVTAVLLNFRGYDTLLEMGVLVLAALGMLATRRARDLSRVPESASDDPVLDWLVKLLVPILVLTAAHLLLLGTRRAGGGFQAGAVLATAAVLLLLAGHRSVPAIRGLRFRAALLSGFVLFLASAVGPMLAGGRLLEFSPGTSSGLILAIEAAIAVATGFTLAALLAGARPLAFEERAERAER